MLVRPAAGKWTISPDPDSAPITTVQSAEELPQPKVSARVSGRGRHRTLRYRLRPIAGQKVTFLSRGRDVEQKIGVARGTNGKLRFDLTDGPAGRRSVIAQVESYRGPRAMLRVTQLRAPGPLHPGVPEDLRARRRGSRICATWTPARSTSRYTAVFKLRDGRRQLVTTRRPSACVANVLRRTASGKALITGLTDRGVRGPTATVRVK